MNKGKTSNNPTAGSTEKKVAKDTSNLNLYFDFRIRDSDDKNLVHAVLLLNKSPKITSELMKQIYALAKESADKGNKNAQYFIASRVIGFYSKVLELDDTNALNIANHYLLLAAEGSDGIPQAKYYVGNNYIKAINHFASNPEEGYRLLKEAEIQGFLPAKYYLAKYCYAYGVGVAQDKAKSFLLMKELVEQYQYDAYAELALAYQKGSGTEINIPEALKIMKEGIAKHNCPFCKVIWAEYTLLLSETISSTDAERALQWLREIAKTNTQSQAHLILAKCYQVGKGVDVDLKKAFEMWKIAADGGGKDAAYEVALCYTFGKGVPLDKVAAFKYHKICAEQGSEPAELACGLCYLQGDGVERDVSEAIKWLERAAKSSNESISSTATSQLLLANQINEQNELYRADLEKAKKMLASTSDEEDFSEDDPTSQKAVKILIELQKCSDAKIMGETFYTLAECYKNGNGVKQNVDEFFRLIAWLCQKIIKKPYAL